jgi:hypothetical protein
MNIWNQQPDQPAPCWALERHGAATLALHWDFTGEFEAKHGLTEYLHQIIPMTSVNKWRTVEVKVDLLRDPDTFSILDKSTKIGEDSQKHHRMWIPRKLFHSFIFLLNTMAETILQPQIEDAKSLKRALTSKSVSENGVILRADIVASLGLRGRERIVIVSMHQGAVKDDISIPWIHLTRFVDQLKKIRIDWNSAVPQQ